MINFDQTKLALVLVVVFLIPGWSLLALTGLWKTWRPLQRWMVAIAASLAFYPILFYLARLLLPSLRLGPNKMLVLLIAGCLAVMLALRRSWREQFAFDEWEWFSIAAFGATIFTRFWIIRDHPYPAWSDSLHHTLLTQLTAQQGQLPHTLQPYSGAVLDMYHLGLYAITGVVQQLSGAPAHTALLWTAQLINGLCAIGVYFVLDRFVGRHAALTGVVVAGLLSFQPAWYVNWGRFTQLASQTILLVAFGVTWQVLDHGNLGQARMSVIQRSSIIFLAAMLNAAVFLLHFRVAGYYLPLLVCLVIIEFISATRLKITNNLVMQTTKVGITGAALIWPALLPALEHYIMQSTQTATQFVSREAIEATFQYSLSSFFGVGLHPWLFWITIIAGIISFFNFRRLASLFWIWTVLLILEGNLFQLNIEVLRFTNFSAILISLYLIAAVMIGTGIETGFYQLSHDRHAQLEKVLLIVLFSAGFVASYNRASGIETWRYFMTENDVQAMNWISSNTPNNAVFAINTFIWLGGYPHGTDGGYWIPYFSGRQTNAGTMLFPLAQPEEINLIQQRSKSVVDFIGGTIQVSSLCESNLDYLYIGEMGNPFAQPFDLERLLLSTNTSLVFQNESTAIFKLCP